MLLISKAAKLKHMSLIGNVRGDELTSHFLLNQTLRQTVTGKGNGDKTKSLFITLILVMDIQCQNIEGL